MWDTSPSHHAPALSGVDIDCHAMMQSDGVSQPVHLVNVARHAVLLDIAEPPELGAMVAISYGPTTISGQVEWRQGERCLMVSPDEINVPDMIGGLFGIGAQGRIIA